MPYGERVLCRAARSSTYTIKAMVRAVDEAREYLSSCVRVIIIASTAAKGQAKLLPFWHSANPVSNDITQNELLTFGQWCWQRAVELHRAQSKPR